MALPEHEKWLKLNGHSLAPLTGTDRRALAAIDACWELYAFASNGVNVLTAVHQLLLEMQPKCWPLARELIARSMDWGDRDRLWSLVAPGRGEGVPS